MSKAKVL